jgi:hypothetical protein
MGHTLTPTGRIPKARPKIDEIPSIVGEDVEDALAYWMDGNLDLLSYEADSKEAGENDLRLMRAYARNHEPRLAVYGNVTKDGTVKYRVTRYGAVDDTP